MIRHGESPRLHHPGLGAVPADADRALIDGPAGAGLSRRTTIRSRSRARRSICRRGAPAGWRATVFLDVTESDAAILPRIVADRRRRRGRDRVRRRRRPARSPADALDSARRARRARAAHAAGAAGAQMGRHAEVRPARKAKRRWSPTIRPSALALADDLARLMDDMTTRGCRGTGSTSSCRTRSTTTGSSRCSS